MARTQIGAGLNFLPKFSPAPILAAVLLAAGTVAARQAPPPAPATGLIIGQIVDADSGRPIAETVVTLMPVTTGAVNPMTAMATAKKLITDPNGRFVYRDLAKGRYTIGTMKPGYVNGQYGKEGPRGPGTQLELADGERLTDVRILMWKHAAITGRIVDESGEPVVGAEIRVRRVTMLAGRPGFQSMLTGSVTTDDRGMYRVPGLEPGRYVIGVASTSTTLPAAMVESYFRATGTAKVEMQQALFAAAPTMSSPGSAANQVIGDHVLQVENRMPTPPGSVTGDTRAIYAATYYPQASRMTEASPIELKGGETRSGIDLSIRAVPTVRIAGRLEGPESSVGIASVYLVQANAGEPLGTTAEATATTVSDVSGAFTFLAIPPGQYVMFTMKWPLAATPGLSQAVVIQGPGGTSSRGVVSEGGGETKPAYWAQQTLSVGDADILGLSVPMNAGLRVSGKVVFEGPGQPPPMQRLYPLLETTATWLRPLSFGEATVGAEGAFALAGAPAGRYLLTMPVPNGYYVKGALSAGRDLSDLPFELKEDLTDVVVTVSNRAARVSGTVRARDGKPDAGAGVIIFPVDNRYWVDFSSYARRIREARAGRDGSFVLSDLPAGDYYVVAVPQAQMDWSKARFLERLSQVAGRLTLAEGEQKAVDLVAAQVR